MIIDHIQNAELYFKLDKNIKKALKYLQNKNFKGMEPGNYEVDGDRIYAVVQEYQTLPQTKAKWESHEKYIDIQYMINGTERMGISRKKKMTLLHDYNKTNDITIFRGDGDFFKLESEHFVILFRDDIHMPKVEVESSGPEPIFKVVMKVQLESSPKE